MKKILITAILVCSAFLATFGQDVNPLITNITISPAAVAVNDVATLSFTLSNPGAAVPVAAERADRLVLRFTLSSGEPDNTDPLASLGGTYKDLFVWFYDDATSTYTGIQRAEIPADADGTITVSYLTTEASSGSNPTNGFSVNLVPTLAGNDLGDDDSYKFTSEDGSLPVTLASFNAREENDHAVLSWVTTEETNSAYFDIEQSLNGKNWSKIGKVEARGESRQVASYSFTDPEKRFGTSYYRLKSVDTDDSFSYSSIVSLRFSAGLAAEVYPNPVTDRINLRKLDIERVSGVQLVNANGGIVYRQTGLDSPAITTTGLAPGMYILRLEFKNGETATRKVLIER